MPNEDESLVFVKNTILKNIVLELKEFILENIALEPHENAEDIARNVLKERLDTDSFKKEIAKITHESSNEDWRKTFNRLREQAIKEIQSWL